MTGRPSAADSGMKLNYIDAMMKNKRNDDKRMRQMLLTALLFLFPWLAGAASYVPLLRQLGMENIREATGPEGVYLCWEDPVYRGPVRGLAEVLRQLAAQEELTQDAHLVLLENGWPQLLITVPAGSWTDYREERVTWTEFVNSLELTYDTDEAMRHFSGAKTEHRSAGKVDFVIYPQLQLRNSWLDKIYGASVNIAPAIEMQLWKGASFTGQVIFPIWNNLIGEMDYIRAGILTLRQEVRLPKRWMASLTVGNFTQQRIGADLQLTWRTADDRWLLGARGGLTGASVVQDGHWQVSRWERLSGAVWGRYFEPHYQLELELTAERYIYGDYGARLDCVRHFGETTVGLFAMVSGGEANGGFSFSVPLPRKKRMRRKAVRVRLPEYWGLTYEAQSGNEYAERRLGRRYQTEPVVSRSNRFYNPDFVRKQLLRQ